MCCRTRGTVIALQYAAGLPAALPIREAYMMLLFYVLMAIDTGKRRRRVTGRALYAVGRTQSVLSPCAPIRAELSCIP